MKISVVLPFLDEAQALPATLAHLARAAAHHRDVEVLAVDGGSSDASRAILARHPTVRVVEAPRGRARQMNAGAAAARGDVLLFLHADTALPHDALRAIAAAAAAPGFVYGGFHHRFSGADWRLALISRLHNYRCRKARTFYGDQALFVARKEFERAGGFPEQEIEDIALCQRLRERGPPAFLDATVVTSSRKFEHMGVWRSFGRVIAILVCLRLGRPPPRAFFADIR
ncbi:MAG: TIGR04283 family arsenosugar biosynthesis glycosyltransferase [Betaproteobacteria bacterium]